MSSATEKKSEIRKEIEPTHKMQLLWLGPLPNYPGKKKGKCVHCAAQQHWNSCSRTGNLALQEHLADDGMRLAIVRNRNSHVQMALHAAPASACGDKKLHRKNGGGRKGEKNCLPEGYHMSGWLKQLPWKYKSDLAVNRISAITDCVGITGI